MSTMKPPIWERQGRPKPPQVTAGRYTYYMVEHRRKAVWKGMATRRWIVSPEHHTFPTFAEAIAYADREARR